MRVICDGCKKEFKIKLKNKKVGGYKITYFRCPKCGREYTVTYDNNKTKNLRLRIKTVLETLNHNPEEGVRMKKERERALLVEMLKQEEAKIKANIKKENDDGRK